MEHNFKRGDLILVGDSRHYINNERIFLTYIEGANSPWVCVGGGNENNFLLGQDFAAVSHPFAKPIEEPKLTEKEAIEKIIEHLKLDIKLK